MLQHHALRFQGRSADFYTYAALKKKHLEYYHIDIEGIKIEFIDFNIKKRNPADSLLDILEVLAKWQVPQVPLGTIINGFRAHRGDRARIVYEELLEENKPGLSVFGVISKLRRQI